MHKDNGTLEKKKIQLAADCSKEKLRVMQQSASYQHCRSMPTYPQRED